MIENIGRLRKETMSEWGKTLLEAIASEVKIPVPMVGYHHINC